jgi:hypothetical protein
VRGGRSGGGGVKRGWTAVGASSRSWRSLDEEVRTASYSSFFLLTVQESPEQRAESGSRALPRRSGPGEGLGHSRGTCALVSTLPRSRTRCPTPSVLLSYFLVNNNINDNTSNSNNNNNKSSEWRISYARAEARARQHHHRPPALSLILWSSLPPAPLATPSCFPFGHQEARLFPILVYFIVVILTKQPKIACL